MATPSSSTIFGNFYFANTVTFATVTLAAGCVTNSNVAAGAAITADKMQHQYEVDWGQDATVTSTSEQRCVHVVRGATATLLAFRAGIAVLPGAATTLVFDLLKNGNTVLTGTISLSNANTAYIAVAAAGFTSTSAVTGDVFEVKTTASGANPGKGGFAQLELREDPS